MGKVVDATACSGNERWPSYEQSETVLDFAFSCACVILDICTALICIVAELLRMLKSQTQKIGSVLRCFSNHGLPKSECLVSSVHC